MNVEVTKSFEKDVLKISDKKIANLIGKAIILFFLTPNKSIN